MTKPVNTLPKNVDANDPTIYKPIPSPRASANVLDKKLKEARGININDGLTSPRAPVNLPLLDV